MTRIISALVLIALVVSLVLYAPVWLFAILVGGVSLIGLYEFFAIAEASQIYCLKPLGYVGAVATIGALYTASREALLPLLILLLLALLLTTLAVIDDFHRALASVATTFFGIFYVAFLLGLLIPIRKDFPALHGVNYYYIFFPMVVTWAGDTGAYYVGRSLGRHKLAPRISPKKTVEGALGGVVASLLGGFIFYWVWPLPEPPGAIFLLALAIAVLGQFGDAAESLLKRGAAIKDSSALIPGHGGVLDRIDSLLFAVPVMYLYLSLFRRFSGG